MRRTCKKYLNDRAEWFKDFKFWRDLSNSAKTVHELRICQFVLSDIEKSKPVYKTKVPGKRCLNFKEWSKQLNDFIVWHEMLQNANSIDEYEIYSTIIEDLTRYRLMVNYETNM